MEVRKASHRESYRATKGIKDHCFRESAHHEAPRPLYLATQ